MDGLYNASVSEYGPLIWQLSKDIVNFPPAPLLPPSEKAFECPYCFTLSSGEVLAEKAWKRNLEL
jgi:hypothetical protein